MNTLETNIGELERLIKEHFDKLNGLIQTLNPNISNQKVEENDKGCMFNDMENLQNISKEDAITYIAKLQNCINQINTKYKDIIQENENENEEKSKKEQNKEINQILKNIETKIDELKSNSNLQKNDEMTWGIMYIDELNGLITNTETLRSNIGKYWNYLDSGLRRRPSN